MILEFFEELVSLHSKTMGFWIQWIFGTEDTPQEVRAYILLLLRGVWQKSMPFAMVPGTRIKFLSTNTPVRRALAHRNRSDEDGACCRYWAGGAELFVGEDRQMYVTRA